MLLNVISFHRSDKGLRLTFPYNYLLLLKCISFCFFFLNSVMLICISCTVYYSISYCILAYMCGSMHTFNDLFSWLFFHHNYLIYHADTVMLVLALVRSTSKQQPTLHKLQPPYRPPTDSVYFRTCYSM